MGRTLITLAGDTAGVEVTAALEHPRSAHIGVDAGLLAGDERLGVEVRAEVTEIVRAIDVLVDFTVPESTLNNVAACASAGTRMVVGTTGLGAAVSQLERAAADIALVFAPNMSVGVNLCFRVAELAAATLGDDFDVEIIEAHHRYKIDAPSGTAVKMGEIVAAALGRDLAACAVYGREGETGPRDSPTIGFATIRAGEIVGDHTLLFAGSGERVEITHRAASRTTFASGALRAARWVMTHDRGLFDMQDVLGLRG